MSIAHHVVVGCDHPRCHARFRVRMILGKGSVDEARKAAAVFGWSHVALPGGQKKVVDHCPAHAAASASAKAAR